MRGEMAGRFRVQVTVNRPHVMAKLSLRIIKRILAQYQGSALSPSGNIIARALQSNEGRSIVREAIITGGYSPRARDLSLYAVQGLEEGMLSVTDVCDVIFYCRDIGV